MTLFGNAGGYDASPAAGASAVHLRPLMAACDRGLQPHLPPPTHLPPALRFCPTKPSSDLPNFCSHPRQADIPNICYSPVYSCALGFILSAVRLNPWVLRCQLSTNVSFLATRACVPAILNTKFCFSSISDSMSECDLVLCLETKSFRVL